MKNLLLFMFLVPVLAFAQDKQVLFPEKDGAVVYEEVIELSKSKKQLYQNAKLFMVGAFRDANKAIQSDDKETGQIISKGNFEHSVSVLGKKFFMTDHFTFQVDCKDGKYRYRIYDIFIESENGTRSSVDTYNDYIRQSKSGKKSVQASITAIDSQMNNLIAALKSAMSKETASDNF